MLQCYAIAEVGVIAYESEAREGMIVNEHVIVEIVRPGTGDPVAEGEVGEVVVTSFNPDYPMIRLATGDLSALLRARSPCGRTNMRIKGWMGRADQTAKVKGMFVRPGAGRRGRQTPSPELGRLRLVGPARGRTGRHDADGGMRRAAPGLADAVAASLQSVTKVRGEVKLVAPGQPAERRQGDRRRAAGRGGGPCPVPRPPGFAQFYCPRTPSNCDPKRPREWGCPWGA